MFSWICPQCGREVPPSYTECPDCTERARQAGAALPPTVQPAPPQPAQPAYQPQAPAYQPQAPAYQPAPPQAPPPQAPPPQGPPPQAMPPQPYYAPAPQPGVPPQQQYYAPPPPQYAPPPYQYAPAPPPAAPAPAAYAQPERRGINLPVWLMTLLFALAIGGLVGGIYWLTSRGSSTPNAPSATVESPAAKPGAKTHPLQKFIEISGVRFVPDPKKKDGTMVKFLIVNHSDSDVAGLAGNVTVWGRTQSSEEDAQGTFSFQTDLGPNEYKELSAPFNTKLKIYELPDWQNVTTDVQITAPPA